MRRGFQVLPPRVAGFAFLVGAGVFLGGALASIPLVDSKGTSIYFLSPQQELPVIAAHADFWQLQSLLQLGGSMAATIGFVLLTLTLWSFGNRVWSLLGFVALLLSEALWIVIEAFRLGTSVWATQEATTSTTELAFYDLLFRWLEGSLFAIAISLALGALVAYGGAFLVTTGLPRWVGWITLAYACLGLGLVVFAGASLVPPEYVYLALLFLGVVLVLRRKPEASTERGVRNDVTGSTPVEASAP